MEGPNEFRIKCTQCNTTSKPTKWFTRDILGIFLIPLGLIPALLYFMESNPYYCPKCQQRDKLIKVYKNKELRIKALSRCKFVTIYFLILISPALIALLLMLSLIAFDN